MPDEAVLAKSKAALVAQVPAGITHASTYPQPPLLESRRDEWHLHFEANFFNETGAPITYQTGEFVARRAGIEVRHETIDVPTFNAWHNEYPAGGGLRVPAQSTIDNGSRVVFFNPFVEFPDGQDPDEVSLSFQFAELSQPIVIDQVAAVRFEQNASVYSLPFSEVALGSWFIGNGHDLGQDQYGTPGGHRFAVGFPPSDPYSVVISQRYANDFGVFDENHADLRFGSGSTNSDYYVFGQEILAIGGGTVLEAVDGVADNVPGQVGSGAGNHVVIDHGNGEISVYAHFRQGSVAVATGQTVAKGQLLGQVGNSGASSGPHLHFELNRLGSATETMPYTGDDGLPTYHDNSGFNGKGRAFSALPPFTAVSVLPEGALLVADYERSTDGFTFDSPNGVYAAGEVVQSGGFQSPGAASLRLGGVDSTEVSDLVASWDNTFFVANEGPYELSLRYDLTQSADYELDEFSRFTVHLFGPVSQSFEVASVSGNGDGGADVTTEWQLFEQDLGVLPEGRYVIALEAYNNHKNAVTEQTTLLLDDVLVRTRSVIGECNEQVASDLGFPGSDSTVSNTACLRVRDGYPFWWGTRTMKLETTTNGSYPIPFEWTNACSGSGGSGLFTGNWQAQLLSSVSAECATVIDLHGSGTGNVTLRYWAQ